MEPPGIPGQFKHLRIREVDLAFEFLEQAFDERDPEMVYLRVSPVLGQIRTDPRFEDLVRRVGIPEW